MQSSIYTISVPFSRGAKPQCGGAAWSNLKTLFNIVLFQVWGGARVQTICPPLFLSPAQGKIAAVVPTIFSFFSGGFVSLGQHQVGLVFHKHFLNVVTLSYMLLVLVLLLFVLAVIVFFILFLFFYSKLLFQIIISAFLSLFHGGTMGEGKQLQPLAV